MVARVPRNALTASAQSVHSPAKTRKIATGKHIYVSGKKLVGEPPKPHSSLLFTLCMVYRSLFSSFSLSNAPAAQCDACGHSSSWCTSSLDSCAVSDVPD